MPPERVKVAGPVTALVGEDGRSNATLIGDRETVVCIDALHAPSLAISLTDASDSEFGRIPDLMVYSHFHGDHVLGADSIGTNLIVAHNNTRSFLATSGEAERSRIAANGADLGPEINAAGIHLPNAVFDDGMTLHAGSVEMELTYVGPAHTNSDIVCHIPELGVLIAGDVVVFGVLPVLTDADVKGWLSALRRLSELDIERLVPGHGLLTDGNAISLMLDLLEHLHHEVESALGRGTATEDISNLIGLPAPFDNWGRQERLAMAVSRIAAEIQAQQAVGE